MYFYCMILCLFMTTLTELFPCFFLSCKAIARVKPAKTGHGPHSSQLLCSSMYFLCCSMYCLFCDVPCIVCVYMCTEQLPPGGYPIAVKYISYLSLTTEYKTHRKHSLQRTYFRREIVIIYCENHTRMNKQDL